MDQLRGENKVKAYEVTLELCGEPHKFEVDTRATRTVLVEQTYNKLCDKLELKTTKAVLSTYMGEKIAVSRSRLSSIRMNNMFCQLWL